MLLYGDDYPNVINDTSMSEVTSRLTKYYTVRANVEFVQ